MDEILITSYREYVTILTNVINEKKKKVLLATLTSDRRSDLKNGGLSTGERRIPLMSALENKYQHQLNPSIRSSINQLQIHRYTHR